MARQVASKADATDPAKGDEQPKEKGVRFVKNINPGEIILLDNDENYQFKSTCEYITDKKLIDQLRKHGKRHSIIEDPE